MKRCLGLISLLCTSYTHHVLSTDTPSSTPTQLLTIPFPPTSPTPLAPTETDYNHKEQNIIEGIAIFGSLIGLMIIITICIITSIEMWKMRDIYQSIDWKFRHLTLAQVEQHNLIIEMESYSRLSQVGENRFNRLQYPPLNSHEIELGDEYHENDSLQEQQNERNRSTDRDPGVVVGIQLNSI